MKEDAYVTFEEIDYAMKKAKRRERTQAVTNFVRENKETLLTAAPVALGIFGIAKKAIGFFGKRKNIKDERYLKERFVYDRSLGRYWETNRNLTNSDWLKIDSLRRKGVPLGKILDRIGVLK